MLKPKNIIIGMTLVLSMGIYTNLSCQAAGEFIEDVDTYKLTHTQEIINYEKTPVMSDYIAQSRKKIKNNWYPPSSSFENTATIIVTLDKEGKLLNCTLATPSEDEGFNDSLIKAVKKTKFSPLPDEFKDDSVNIDFTFNMQKRHIRK